MSTKIYKNITVYKDFDCRKPYPTKAHVEIQGDGEKARLINPTPVFGEVSQSRFNKLSNIGQGGTKGKVKSYYAITVEGKRVFFIIESNI